jgi:single-strand DNA-binding protein
MLQLLLTGYLGTDATVKSVNDQMAISFSVGVTKQWRDRQGQPMTKTTWIGCTLWRKPENTRIAEFLKRGQQVLVKGEPTVRAYIKQTDGTAQGVMDCRVDYIELLGKAPVVETAPASSTPPAAADLSAGSDNDDLPF